MKNAFSNKTSLTTSGYIIYIYIYIYICMYVYTEETERTQRGRAYLCLDQQQPFGEMMTAQASQDPNSLSNYYNHHFHDL